MEEKDRPFGMGVMLPLAPGEQLTVLPTELAAELIALEHGETVTIRRDALTLQVRRSAPIAGSRVDIASGIDLDALALALKPDQLIASTLRAQRATLRKALGRAGS